MKRLFVTIFIFSSYLFLVVSGGCKQLQEKPVAPGESGKNSHGTAEPPSTVSTSAAPLSTSESATGTSEAAISTSEQLLSTEEWGATTAEEDIATREFVYSRRTIQLYDEPKAKPLVIAKIKSGTRLYIEPDSYATKEWIHVKAGDFKGYVLQADVCHDMFCMTKKRNGIIILYDLNEELRTPQMQLSVSNIFPYTIRDLRIAGRFYYRGEPIGEDEAYVAAETLGIPPLGPGQTKVVYMRPRYNLPPKEVVSPKNPVTVELLCALESFNYVPCGETNIEQMLY